MNISRLFAGAAVAGLLLASQARAATLIVAYQGVVSNGFDLTGVFGQAKTSLTGDAFKVTFVFDDKDPRGFSQYDPPLRSSFNYMDMSGQIFSAPRISVEINHHSFSFYCASPDYCAYDHAAQSGYSHTWGVTDNLNYFAVDTTVTAIYRRDIDLGITSSLNHFVTNFDYHTPLFHTIAPGDLFQGHLLISDEIIPNGLPVPSYFSKYVMADLVPLSVSVALPEPTVWTMMILGFGMVGLAARRRSGMLAGA